MTLRSNKRRPLTRKEKKYRDDRLFIIATEDTYCPTHYFDLFHNSRIHVHVLPTREGRSAPEHVLRRLNDYVEEHETMEEDEFWLVLDTDHWTEPNHIASFSEVCTEASQKGFQSAHSNPCFELWLLLHLTDLDTNEQFARCEEVVERLKAILGGYSKKRGIDPTHFSPEARILAVDRAENLDGDSPSGDRWPQKTGSHVYRLVKKLLQQ